jgi:hypothetical protein
MAVITPANLSAAGLRHTPVVDLLESGDERERRPLAPLLLAWRPPSWVVVLLAVLAVGTVTAGALAVAEATRERAREAARLEVDVRPAGTSSTTVGGVSRGELTLLLVNRREQRVRLGGLRLAVEGLRVTGVEPAFGKPLGAYEERTFRILFVVPDCSRLVLPGRVQVSLAADRQPVERRELAVVDPDVAGPGADGFALGGCPPSARGRSAGTSTDVGVRPAGGSSSRDGVGATGFLRLEVRNAGPPLRLVSITGEVPGVRFTPRELEGGRSVDTDGLVIVRLAFRIDDCALLQPAGRLVMVVERFGAQQELGLRAVAEPEAGVGPQVDLGVLFDACD